MRRQPSAKVVLAVVSFGVFVAADDLTVVTTMLRQIIADLEIPLPDGLDDAAWIVNSYLVAYVAVMPIAGRLSDMMGRLPVYLGALALFMAGSIWIPLAGSLPTFVAARVVTAIGGGALVPVALAAIGDVYREGRRERAYGLLAAIDTLGWVWGPLFGAFLVRYLSWEWQFHLNVPLAALGMVAAWWVLRGLPKPVGRRRLDWIGAVLLTIGLVALNVALLDWNHISTADSLAELTGGTASATAPGLIIAAIALMGFVIVERRSADPLIDFRMLGRRSFAPAVAVNFLVGAVLVIAMVDVPLFVNLVVDNNLERAAVHSGWVLSALTAAMAVASYLGGTWSERASPRPVAVTGLLAAAVAFLLMGLVWDTATGPLTMAWMLAILGAGLGLVTAPANAVAIDAAPAESRGVAAGLVLLARLIGLSVGLSGLTAWGLYRFGLLRSALDLPPITDPGYGDALAAASADITATALSETFLFSMAVTLVAVMVATLLRQARPASK